LWVEKGTDGRVWLSAMTRWEGRDFRMSSWGEFELAEPEFARRVRALMSSRKHLTMATLRRDGSPRISGTEIEFAHNQMKIGSMAGAVKAQDLFRDARVAIHGPTADPPQDSPEDWSGEAKIAGKAVADGSGSDSHAFTIDVEEAVITSVSGDKLVIESWTPSRGYRKIERS